MLWPGCGITAVNSGIDVQPHQDLVEQSYVFLACSVDGVKESRVIKTLECSD
jgi:hypothetical protein